MTGRRRSKARATRFASWIRFLFRVAALLWRAGLPRVGLRSSPKTTEGAALILVSRIIVNDLRGQARLLQGSTHASTIRSATRPPRFAFDCDLGRPPKSLSDYGHTEPRRGAECWGKSPFGYFWGSFPKVTRREGGTNISRYPNIGYVHNQKLPPTQSKMKLS